LTDLTQTRSQRRLVYLVTFPRGSLPAAQFIPRTCRR